MKKLNNRSVVLADTDLALMLNRAGAQWRTDRSKNLERLCQTTMERASVQRWVKHKRKTK